MLSPSIFNAGTWIIVIIHEKLRFHQMNGVYALDPRGFGDSDLPAEGYDLDTAGHDIHVFIEQLGLARSRGVDIVGHDVGSWIAHAHAANHPDDVRRLVVSDAHIPGVSPAPPGDYPLEIETVNRIWHFYFNRLEGLPEALIHGREREFLAWWFGPNKLVRTWAIDQEASRSTSACSPNLERPAPG